MVAKELASDLSQWWPEYVAALREPVAGGRVERL